MPVQLTSVITCPSCGTKATETMPEDACQIQYTCTGCGTTLKPLAGDCCVFCSHGSVECPPVQRETPKNMDSGLGSECWCCGSWLDPAQMVHLGNHPEVSICVNCVRWAGKEAGEIEDRDKSGLGVKARGGMRAIRHVVVNQGWHRNRVVGGLLRRVGRFVP